MSWSSDPLTKTADEIAPTSDGIDFRKSYRTTPAFPETISPLRFANINARSGTRARKERSPQSKSTTDPRAAEAVDKLARSEPPSTLPRTATLCHVCSLGAGAEAPDQAAAFGRREACRRGFATRPCRWTPFRAVFTFHIDFRLISPQTTTNEGDAHGPRILHDYCRRRVPIGRS